LISSSRTQGSC